MDKKKINNHKNKLFGRNLFTLIFTVAAIVIIAFVAFTVQSYISTSSNTRVEPFVTKSLSSTDNSKENFSEGIYNIESSKTNGIEEMNGKDFDKIGLKFYCTEYNEDKGTASYQLQMYFTDNTPEEIKYNTKFSANVCMTSKWIGFISYASKTTSIIINTPYFKRVYNSDVTKNPDDTYYVPDNNSRFGYREATSEEVNNTNTNKYVYEATAEERIKENLNSPSKNTFSISNIPDFPAKANTWPIKVKVSAPTIYLYLSYEYTEDAITKTKTYILKYSYKELMTSDTSGAIRD